MTRAAAMKQAKAEANRDACARFVWYDPYYVGQGWGITDRPPSSAPFFTVHSDAAMTALDRAVLAYRDCPSPANHAALMAAQADHAERFLRAQTGVRR